MSLYAAVDLHSSNSVLAVMDGAGKALLQCRRPNDLPRILADLAPYQPDLAGAILAPHETQRLVVSGKTGVYPSAAPGDGKCVSLDYGRRNGEIFLFLPDLQPGLSLARGV